jgi:hypothetical protein
MAEIRPLFLDTTIQVDRLLEEFDPENKKALEEFLKPYGYLMTSSFSRLEYKRLVLQNLNLCLKYIVQEKSFFLALKRVASLGQRSRRPSTLINVLSWLGKRTDSSTIEVNGPIDEQLAMRCETYIRNSIISIWKRFDKSVHSVVDRTQCALQRRPQEDSDRTALC